MLFDHDSVDTFGISESKEAETSRTAGRRITHDSAFADLTKLSEVILEGVYGLISKRGCDMCRAYDLWRKRCKSNQAYLLLSPSSDRQ